MSRNIVGAILFVLVQNGAALAATIGLLLIGAAVHLSAATLSVGAGLFIFSGAIFVWAGGLRGR